MPALEPQHMFAEVTHSELDPKCDMLKFPAHLKWARHKADIRETEGSR